MAIVEPLVHYISICLQTELCTCNSPTNALGDLSLFLPEQPNCDDKNSVFLVWAGVINSSPSPSSLPF